MCRIEYENGKYINFDVQDLEYYCMEAIVQFLFTFFHYDFLWRYHERDDMSYVGLVLRQRHDNIIFEFHYTDLKHPKTYAPNITIFISENVGSLKIGPFHPFKGTISSYALSTLRGQKLDDLLGLSLVFDRIQLSLCFKERAMEHLIIFL